MCDEAGFPYDKKYKTPQLARTSVLITSNFTPRSCINDMVAKDTKVTMAALQRRFMIIRIDELLAQLGIALKDEEYLTQLKELGNEDVSHIFRNTVNLLQEIPTPMECQDIIKNFYYNVYYTK